MQVHKAISGRGEMDADGCLSAIFYEPFYYINLLSFSGLTICYECFPTISHCLPLPRIGVRVHLLLQNFTVPENKLGFKLIETRYWIQTSVLFRLF